MFNGKIYQMTYREGKVFVLDPNSLTIISEMKMPIEMEEGWGLTHDDTYLYASDGTNQIFKINPENFSVVEIIQVKDRHGKEIRYINELELVGSHVYGNVLPLNVIIKVDLETGIVDKIYDFKKLHDIQMEAVKASGKRWDSQNNVMNGIAFRKSNDNFLVTGKEWNFIFEVKLE